MTRLVLAALLSGLEVKWGEKKQKSVALKRKRQSVSLLEHQTANFFFFLSRKPPKRINKVVRLSVFLSVKRHFDHQPPPQSAHSQVFSPKIIQTTSETCEVNSRWLERTQTGQSHMSKNACLPTCH